MPTIQSPSRELAVDLANRGVTGFNRRNMLAASGACLLGSLPGCATRPSGNRALKLGLADITVMRELLRDYAGTLQLVKAMGYTTFGFRLVGYGGAPDAGEPSPELKARLVRDAGLEVGVVRLGVRNADYDRQLAQAADIGAKIVVMTTAPPFLVGPVLFETTLEKFQAWLPELAAIGENARRRGLILAYHNHPHDFIPLSGERPFDLMVRGLPPEVLSFEVDLAWAWLAGVAPLELVASLGGRVVSMHWKDVERRRGVTRSDMAVPLSAGEMNYPVLLPRLRSITDAIGYIEVDKPDDGIAAARMGVAVVRRALAPPA